MCALAPGTKADITRAVESASRAVQLAPDRFYYRDTFGAILYRAGQFNAAIEQLRESMRIQEKQSEAGQGAPTSKQVEEQRATPMAFDWLFLAMAQHKLGHGDEAEVQLDKVVRSMEESEQERSLEASFSWNVRLEMRLVRREAEALIEGKGL